MSSTGSLELVSCGLISVSNDCREGKGAGGLDGGLIIQLSSSIQYLPTETTGTFKSGLYKSPRIMTPFSTRFLPPSVMYWDPFIRLCREIRFPLSYFCGYQKASMIQG